jgi:hypothetical protein
MDEDMSKIKTRTFTVRGGGRIEMVSDNLPIPGKGDRIRLLNWKGKPLSYFVVVYDGVVERVDS